MAEKDIMAGVDGEIKVEAQRVAYIDRWSVNRTKGTADTSQCGVRDDECIETNRSWTASISGTYNATDEGQNALETHMDGDTGEPLSFTFREGKTTTHTGKGFLTSFNCDGERAGKVSFSAEIKGTGKLVKGVYAPPLGG